MSAPVPSPAAFVGRDRELGVLRERLAEAIAGQGGLILIGGEADIGKTALAEAVCREAAERGALVLVGRCYDLTETPPYGPWIDLFARYHPGGALPPLPSIFARHGVLGDIANQAALLQQVQEFLAAVSAQQPLVVLVEDLHWSDQSSLDLLRFLARALPTLPLLMIVTYRPDDITRHHPLYSLLPLLVRESSAARIDLGPLAEAAVRTLVEVRYHLAVAECSRLVSYLQARAQGNALFTAELLRTLEGQGILSEDAAGWGIGDLSRVTVPPLLRQVIDARVSRLGEEARHLLAVAAVIGQDIQVSLWATVADVSEERAARFYAMLLKLYPRNHRRAFGAQMLRTFQDHYQDATAQRDKAGPAFWLAVVSDEMKGITKEQTVALRAGRILPNLLLIGAALLVASSFFWLPGYIVSIKVPVILLLMIGFVAHRWRHSSAAAHHTAEHVWARQGVRCGGLLGLLWVALNLAGNLSADSSPLRDTAKSLDVGILLLGMPILFGLAGFTSGRSSGMVKDGTLAGLLAAVTGAAIMILSLVAIMILCWDVVRGNAFQSAEMIRAWHASGDQSFGRYLWGDNLGGALTVTIVSLVFGGLLGTLGGALGAFLPRAGNGSGQTQAASDGRSE